MAAVSILVEKGTICGTWNRVGSHARHDTKHESRRIAE